MNSYSVKMNSHIFTAFLQATTTVTLSPEQVEAVFGAMANYRACEPATAFVYTALLTFCAKQAPDRALDVWHAMQEVQSFPTPPTPPPPPPPTHPPPFAPAALFCSSFCTCQKNSVRSSTKSMSCADDLRGQSDAMLLVNLPLFATSSSWHAGAQTLVHA